ncbi:MAG: homoserine kinase [Erysipelotrichaceae bacterium]|nr:homoserine kinase [Erysipelotrichaceae bacterium]
MKFKVPATSANLGLGFDCMGLALELYDYFEIEKAERWELLGFYGSISIDENLFVTAYRKASEYKGYKEDPLKVILEDDIPISRGLGSSAALIVGGIYAFNIKHDNVLSRGEMLQIATEIEGHPDNVAPAIYGGLCVVKDDHLLRIDVDERWNFGIWIIDEKVSTSEARKVVPFEYSRDDVINNVSCVVLSIDALKNFNTDNISLIMEDRIHEPFRKKLIPGFEKRKEYALSIGAKAFIISGSGSTCLSISDKSLDVQLKDVVYKEVKVNKEGVINV